jgi:hypothetical protein
LDGRGIRRGKTEIQRGEGEKTVFCCSYKPFLLYCVHNPDRVQPPTGYLLKGFKMVSTHSIIKPDHERDGLPAGTLPKDMRPFFWDVDFDRLSVNESDRFIIARLMEHGDENAARFLLRTFPHDILVRVLKNDRTLSRRSRAFWCLFLGIDERSCMPKQYPTPYGDSSNASMDALI